MRLATSVLEGRPADKHATKDRFVMLKERHTSHRLARPDTANCAALVCSAFKE
jgi:hypothetical protein